jgi:methionine-rich copper-binding protein CopC
MNTGLHPVTARAARAERSEYIGTRRRTAFHWLLAAHVLAIVLVLCLMLDTPALSAPVTAQVVGAIPAMGSTVGQVPQAVVVLYSEPLLSDPQRSTLTVYGPHGTLVSPGAAAIPRSHPRQISVAIRPDGDGVYTVRWATASAQGGSSAHGSFVFTVDARVQTSPPEEAHSDNRTLLLIGAVLARRVSTF